MTFSCDRRHIDTTSFNPVLTRSVPFSSSSFPFFPVMLVEVDVFDVESGVDEPIQSETIFPSGIQSEFGCGIFNIVFVPYALARRSNSLNETVAADEHAYVADEVDADPGHTVRMRCYYDRDHRGEWSAVATFVRAGIRLSLHFDGRE